MAKLKLLAFGLLLICKTISAQTVYPVHYTLADSVQTDTALLRAAFADKLAAMQYIAALPAQLQSKGYVAASIDSARFDSLAAHVTLFLGKAYQWATIATAPEDAVMSVHTDDVDAAYDEARQAGYEIVHPLTTEEWGVRRFLVRAPDGNVINVVRHRE